MVEVKSVREVTDRFWCDWCGKDILYDERENDIAFDLRYMVTTSGPDYHIVRDASWRADLCQDCIGKLKSFLVASGAKLQEGKTIAMSENY